jgi:hypothetical protein
MPGIVAKEGLADKILPLSQLAGEILQRVEEGRNASSAMRAPDIKSIEWQVNRVAQ